MYAHYLLGSLLFASDGPTYLFIISFLSCIIHGLPASVILCFYLQFNVTSKQLTSHPCAKWVEIGDEGSVQWVWSGQPDLVRVSRIEQVIKCKREGEREEISYLN